MSFHSPELTPVASARICIPSGDMPANLWIEYAKIRLLEPEPKLYGEWTRRLADRIHNWSRPKWNVLRVTPQMERKVCETLRDAGLLVHVPIERYRPARTWRSRTRPLIPGYIFVHLPDDASLDLARANHAVRDVMCRDGSPVKVPPIFIGAMILLEACGAYDFTVGAPPPLRDKRRGRRPPRHQWKKGQRVMVLEGPFSGFVAEILNAERADRIEALVEVFGRMTPTAFDEEMLDAR